MTAVRTWNPQDMDPNDIYRFMTDTIQPRPIALVSTISADGRANLAPFSFFCGVGSVPPCLAFCPAVRRPPNVDKDTLANIRATGEFVVAVVPARLVERINQAAYEYEHGVSEFEMAGIATRPATVVRPSCVADSPVNFECQLMTIITTGDQPGSGNMVLGRIVAIHADEDVLAPGRPHAFADRLDLVGRVGGPNYVHTRDRFSLPRPRGPADFPKVGPEQP